MSRTAVDDGARPGWRQEEKSLVAAMLAGDEQAMNEFADGYFPQLYRFALARLRGDAELTRELVQRTVCKALEKLGSYRGEAPLFTWLCACCRNEIAMYFRRQRSRPRAVELDEAATEPVHMALGAPAAPDRALVAKEEVHLVHSTLDQLPPHYARALEWKYLEALSVQEIAARLQLGPKAVESLLTRARRAFRQGYEGLIRRPGVEAVVETGGEP